MINCYKLRPLHCNDDVSNWSFDIVVLMCPFEYVWKIIRCKVYIVKQPKFCFWKLKGESNWTCIKLYYYYLLIKDREKEESCCLQQFFSYPSAITITSGRAANLDLCLALMNFSKEGSFSCHSYCDIGPRFMKSHPKDWHPRPTMGFKPWT
jgi:hypothetical protein